jgi:transposase
MENTKKWYEIIAEKDARIAELEALVKHYEEMFRLSQSRRFGASREKTNPNQMSFFVNEPEPMADIEIEEPEYEEIKYKRRKRKGKRKEDLSALPVETIEYTLPEDEQFCAECDEPLHVMGHEIRREIMIIPAQVKVVEHKQAVYSCRNCETEADHVPIVKAVVPEPVISGSLASPSAVAHIMTQKFVMSSPLYRQEKEWGWYGYPLSRQTMSNWVIRCSDDWLMPIYEKMRLKLLESDVLHADETTLQV